MQETSMKQTAMKGSLLFNREGEGDMFLPKRQLALTDYTAL
jgi:hypothetical protein